MEEEGEGTVAAAAAKDVVIRRVRGGKRSEESHKSSEKGERGRLSLSFM